MDRPTLVNQLAELIVARAVITNHPLRVGIDGVDASGKTTLAGELAETLRAAGKTVISASIDRFHNPRAVRYRLGADSPEGYYRDSFDLQTLKVRLLNPLGPRGDRQVCTERFDYQSDTPVESQVFQAAPDAILLMDGIFLHRPELLPCWDFSIFVRVRFETVLARACQRDQAVLGSDQAVLARYTKKYIPAQQAYLAASCPEHYADVVVINDVPQNPIIIVHERVVLNGSETREG